MDHVECVTRLTQAHKILMEKGHLIEANGVLQAMVVLDELHRRSSPRRERQVMAGKWALAAFGMDNMRPIMRAIRFYEEATELLQTFKGGTAEVAARIQRVVYSRPVGERNREIGGVGLTLLAMGAHCGYDVDQCEAEELERVLSKPLSWFTKRNEEKIALGLYVPPEEEV